MGLRFLGNDEIAPESWLPPAMIEEGVVKVILYPSDRSFAGREVIRISDFIACHPFPMEKAWQQLILHGSMCSARQALGVTNLGF